MTKRAIVAVVCGILAVFLLEVFSGVGVGLEAYFSPILRVSLLSSPLSCESPVNTTAKG
jgi:hypothetical protein